MSGPEYEYDAFLSHNAREKDAVEIIARRLEAETPQIKVWLDKWDLNPGRSSVEGIEIGIAQSRVIVLFLGPSGPGPWHQLERKAAMVHERDSRGQVTIVPVLLPGIDEPKSTIPLLLRDLTWVAFKSIDPIDEDALKLLICGIRGIPVRDLIFQAESQNQLPDSKEPIVPRGLRAFTEKDSHFFLRLLPGPKENALPKSISFWKVKLEETDPDKTFKVGLLDGPSGCGKSSLVKAGIVPRLAEYIRPIFVEANADDTEQRLLNQLRKQFRKLRNHHDLESSLLTLRDDSQTDGGFKVVLFLDQFEQWLHSRRAQIDTPLVRALRCCDGRATQAVIMVRSDFRYEIGEFFDLLGGLRSGDTEDCNEKILPLFERDHAVAILSEFKRAYKGSRSENATTPIGQNGGASDDQEFFHRILDEIQDKKQRVIPAQLALLADILGQKQWSGVQLQRLGGVTGIGREFLHENFDDTAAPVAHTKHRTGVVAVLKALLPSRGNEIKGTSRPKSDLINIAGYQRRLADFEELLRILVVELKLISPTSTDDRESSTIGSYHEPHFQLSHDYLVASLQEWIDIKTKEPLENLTIEYPADTNDLATIRSETLAVEVLRFLVGQAPDSGFPPMFSPTTIADSLCETNVAAIQLVISRLERAGIIRACGSEMEFSIAFIELCDPIRAWIAEKTDIRPGRFNSYLAGMEADQTKQSTLFAVALAFREFDRSFSNQVSTADRMLSLTKSVRDITPILNAVVDIGILRRDSSGNLFRTTSPAFVMTLRTWYRSQFLKTWKGRAYLTLDDREAYWLTDDCNPRQLPTFLQWLKIQCGLPRRHRSADARRMLQKTARRYTWVSIVTLLGLFMFALYSRYESWKSVHVQSLVSQLLEADPDDVPSIVKLLSDYRVAALPQLDINFARAKDISPHKLRLAVAIYTITGRETEYLLKQVGETGPREIILAATALSVRRFNETAKLWKKLSPRDWKKDNRSEPREREVLSIAAILARLEPNNSRWDEYNDKISSSLMNFGLNDNFYWVDALRPAAKKLLPSLRKAPIAFEEEFRPKLAKIIKQVIEDYSREAQVKENGAPLPHH